MLSNVYVARETGDARHKNMNRNRQVRAGCCGGVYLKAEYCNFIAFRRAALEAGCDSARLQNNGTGCRLLWVARAFLQGECAGYFTSGASSVVAAKQLHLGGQGREGLLLLLLLLLTMLLFELRQAGVQAANAHITLAQLSLHISLQAPPDDARNSALLHTRYWEPPIQRHPARVRVRPGA